MALCHGSVKMSSSILLRTLHEPDDLPDPIDPRWLLVQRIARSKSLGRSEQLARFLLYVCRQMLTEHGDELNEQHIGVALFGRAPDYDSSADGIVRSHATRLRHRLAHYFATEGIDEPLLLEIPRGGYLPRFSPRAGQAEATSLPPAESAEEEPPLSALAAPPRHWHRPPWLMPFFLGLLLAILAELGTHLLWNGSLLNGQHTTRQSRIERRFWSTLFPEHGKTLLVPGDSGMVIYEGATRKDFSLADYISGSYRDPRYAKSEAAPPEFLLDMASRRYTSMADMRLTEELSHLPEWSREGSEIVYARDLTPAQVQNNNLILIGSRQANPWLALVEPSLNFALMPDGHGGYQFLNRHPRSGEQPVYDARPDPDRQGSNVVFAQIAYLPNPSGQGMILVLGGLWMSGTQSAGNFVLNNERFRQWLASIARPDGSIPHFELLLRTKNLGGSSEASTILSARLLP